MTEATLSTGIEYFPDPSVGRPLFNGTIFVGIVDLDPTVEANRIAVTVIQEDGTRVLIAPSAQPLVTNAGGQVTYAGEVVSVAVDGQYSLIAYRNNLTKAYYIPKIPLENFITDAQWIFFSDIIYVSATTFTVTDISEFHVGRRIKTDENAYGTITDVSGLTVTVLITSGSMTPNVLSVELGPDADSTSAKQQFWPTDSTELNAINLYYEGGPFGKYNDVRRYGAKTTNTASQNDAALLLMLANDPGVFVIPDGIAYNYENIVVTNSQRIMDYSQGAAENAATLVIKRHLSVDGDIDLFNVSGNPELTFKDGVGYGAGIDLALLFSNANSAPKVWGIKYYNASAVANDIFLISCDTNDPNPRFKEDLTIDKVSGNPAYQLTTNGADRYSMEYTISVDEVRFNTRNFNDNAWKTVLILDGKENQPGVTFPIRTGTPTAPADGIKIYSRNTNGDDTLFGLNLSGGILPITDSLIEFTDGDLTPAFFGATSGKTNNTSNTIINNLDVMIKGQSYIVIIGDNFTTVNFTGGNLIGNGGVDWSPVQDDMMVCIYDGVKKYCAVHTL